jgi:acetolactate synthase-1/2/3 large subunit
MPDRHPWFGGVLTHGALERPVLQQADLFIAVGLDPVELLAKAWTYPQPMVSVNAWPLAQAQLPFAAELVGDVAQGVEAIGACLSAQSDWDADALRQTVGAQREGMRVSGDAHRLWPHRVVELVAEAYPNARVTVDAGAHMFPALALWPAQEPCGLLISNGLATMGFALPAAIGAALLDRSQPTVALTGDGGLLMCTGELRTAARERLPLRIVVFDDSALSLIKIKQVQRGYRTDGITIGNVEWRALGDAMGLPAYSVDDEAALANCLRDTASVEGPVLIAATIDPQPYQQIIRALRG